MAKSDYYEVLGVSRNASEDELKKAQAQQAKADAGLKDADAETKKNGNGDK